MHHRLSHRRIPHSAAGECEGNGENSVLLFRPITGATAEITLSSNAKTHFPTSFRLALLSAYGIALCYGFERGTLFSLGI